MELCKYKPYLKEFNYPNIDILDDEEVANVFSSKNRYFLLKWLTKYLNSEFIAPLDLSDASTKQFADFFVEGGFCRSSQKVYFVKGDKKLTLKEQIIIFDRIFAFLKNNLEKENVKPKQTISSSEDLQLFLHGDMNLFPTLGPLKSYSAKERKKMYKWYEEEIEKIKNTIENTANDNQKTNDSIKYVDECSQRQCEKNIEDFKEEAIKLKDITINIKMNENNIDQFEKKPCFKSDFGSQLIDCNSKTESVLQYFQNLNVIQHLNNKQSQELQDENDYEKTLIFGLLKQTTDTSIDVLELSRTLEQI